MKVESTYVWSTIANHRRRFPSQSNGQYCLWSWKVSKIGPHTLVVTVEPSFALAYSTGYCNINSFLGRPIDTWQVQIFHSPPQDTWHFSMSSFLDNVVLKGIYYLVLTCLCTLHTNMNLIQESVLICNINDNLCPGLTIDKRPPASWPRQLIYEDRPRFDRSWQKTGKKDTKYHSMSSFLSLYCGLEKEYVLVHTAHNYDAHPEEQF